MQNRGVWERFGKFGFLGAMAMHVAKGVCPDAFHGCRVLREVYESLFLQSPQLCLSPVPLIRQTIPLSPRHCY